MSRELRREANERKRERELLDKKQEELAADIRALADSAEGRRIFHWLLEQGNIFRGDYEPGVRGAYAAGKKAAALELWHKLQECLARTDFIAIALPAMHTHTAETATTFAEYQIPGLPGPDFPIPGFPDECFRQ